MKYGLLCPLALAALASSSQEQVAYEFVLGWLMPALGKQSIGNSHGEIQADTAGDLLSVLPSRKSTAAPSQFTDVEKS